MQGGEEEWEGGGAGADIEYCSNCGVGGGRRESPPPAAAKRRSQGCSYPSGGADEEPGRRVTRVAACGVCAPVIVHRPWHAPGGGKEGRGVEGAVLRRMLHFISAGRRARSCAAVSSGAFSSCFVHLNLLGEMNCSGGGGVWGVADGGREGGGGGGDGGEVSRKGRVLRFEEMAWLALEQRPPIMSRLRNAKPLRRYRNTTPRAG